MKNIVFVLLMFISVNSKAATDYEVKSLKFSYPSFLNAKEGKSYVRFDLNSSLLGFLTARFSGFAKEFELSWLYNAESEVVKNLVISIPVSYMDTNKDSRTEEMKVDCLEIKNYKFIKVSIIEPVILKDGMVPVLAKALIRGKEITLKLNLSLIETGNQWTVFGELPTTLKKLNINNPTIAKGIASFDDNVKIYFNFEIKK